MASTVRVGVAEIYKGLRLFQPQQGLESELETVGRPHTEKEVDTTTKVEAVGDDSRLSPLKLQ